MAYLKVCTFNKSKNYIHILVFSIWGDLNFKFCNVKSQKQDSDYGEHDLIKFMVRFMWKETEPEYQLSH